MNNANETRTRCLLANISPRCGCQISIGFTRIDTRVFLIESWTFSAPPHYFQLLWLNDGQLASNLLMVSLLSPIPVKCLCLLIRPISLLNSSAVHAKHTDSMVPNMCVYPVRNRRFWVYLEGLNREWDYHNLIMRFLVMYIYIYKVYHSTYIHTYINK